MNPAPGKFKLTLSGGLASFDRCPKAWLRDEARFTDELLRDFRWLKEYGVLPRRGGKLDQDPRFVDAVEILESELALQARRAAGGRAWDGKLKAI